MIVTHENQRLYLNNWNYNAARIMTELANMVTAAGGNVKPLRSAIITNRTITAAVAEYSELAERYARLEAVESLPVRAEALRGYLENLERLTAFDNSPRTVTHTSYITFTLNGMYYSYSVDDNPFFPFHFYKAALDGMQYNRNGYAVEDKKEWLYDCFFESTCSDENIKRGAKLIFDMLVNARAVNYKNSTKDRPARVDF